MQFNTNNYDYLIVGAGPYGAIFAHEAAKRGKRSLIIERRAHVGGNMSLIKNMVSMSMTLGHTFSIQRIKKFGIMLINLQSSMGILIK
ncbi:UDP-galactopyranose mutase [Lactococcus lactis]|nr:UDP-galactopyranose mutase [Lactococcus lactis]